MLTLEKFLPTLTEARRARLEALGYTPEEFVDDYNYHEDNSPEEHPSVYCGTYAKYNGGSLFGQWIDLTTFGGDFEEFERYCFALHADEPDPELMMQDYQNFPEGLYDECLDVDDFDQIIEYYDLCEDRDSEAVDVYYSLYSKIDADHFRELYVGQWDSMEDFAEHLVSELYDDCLRNMPDLIASHIDYEGIADELEQEYDFEDGYVFRK